MKSFAIAVAVGVLSTLIGTFMYVKFIAPKQTPKPTA